MLVIILFILLLNIVSIVLMYYCLGDLNKREKLIFIAAGVALMYALTTIIYWISTNGIEMTEVSETGKDLITFLFVPINGIIVLPIFAKSYYRYKMGSLSGNVLRNRGILLGIVLVILLIIECVYFKNIQEQVVSLIESNRRNQYVNQQQTEEISNSLQGENTLNDGNSMDSNSIVENSIISNEIVNSVETNTTNTEEQNSIANEIRENVVLAE